MSKVLSSVSQLRALPPSLSPPSPLPFLSLSATLKFSVRGSPSYPCLQSFPYWTRELPILPDRLRFFLALFLKINYYPSRLVFQMSVTCPDHYYLAFPGLFPGDSNRLRLLVIYYLGSHLLNKELWCKITVPKASSSFQIRKNSPKLSFLHVHEEKCFYI